MTKVNFLLAVSMLSLSSFPGVSQDKAHNGGEEEFYLQCIQLVEKDPKKAITIALDRQMKKANTPAKHCEALGLYAIRQPRAAALLLTEVADAMRTGKDMPIVDGKRQVANAEMLAKVYQQTALAWMDSKMLMEALKAADQAVFLAPKGSDEQLEARLLRARIYAKDEDFENAYQDLKIVKEAITSTEVHLLYASAARLSGRDNEALEALTLILVKAPKNITALMERGNLLAAMGKSKLAQEDWFTVIDLDPESKEADFARKNIQAMALAPKKTPPKK